MTLHPKQKIIVSSSKRFKVIRAGRKGGKTALEIEVLCYKAMVSIKKLPIVQKDFKTGRKVLYIAPTQDQARRIVWEALKSRLVGFGKPNEQQLSMKVPNEDGGETTIFVGGWENRENYRGLADVIHITFDEIDTLKNFFISWREIFRPMFLDTSGTADFIGTPKKESGNLRRLEKEAEGKEEWGCFHFTSKDNPFLPVTELNAILEEYRDDPTAYKQEILAEYIENTGSLFKYDALLDVFSNTVQKKGEKYMIVDVADDGSDKTVISLWEDLEEYGREEYKGLNNEARIAKIREVAGRDRIPFSHIAIDGIGVGSATASSSFLEGVVMFKGSFAPIKTDLDIVKLPNVSYLPNAPTLVSDYKNLRSQCVFTLADYVNNHKIASRVTGEFKEKVIEEVFAYQDSSVGDGKRMATKTEDVKELIGRSPDHASTWFMRMYFVIRDKMLPYQTEEMARVETAQKMQFNRRTNTKTSTK